MAAAVDLTPPLDIAGKKAARDEAEAAFQAPAAKKGRQRLPVARQEVNPLYGKRNQKGVPAQIAKLEAEIKDLTAKDSTLKSNRQKTENAYQAELNKQKAFYSGTKLSASACGLIKDAFTTNVSPAIRGAWAWHKNRLTDKGGRVMYFKQQITFDGHTYWAVAHLHGPRNGAWAYTNADDKLDIMSQNPAVPGPKGLNNNADRMCPKMESLGNALGTQIGAGAINAHVANWPDNENAYPALMVDAGDYFDGDYFDGDYQPQFDQQDTIGYSGTSFAQTEIMAMAVVIAFLACVLCMALSCCIGAVSGFVFRRAADHNTREKVNDRSEQQIDV